MPDDIKISALTNVNTLSDTAVFPMVQDLNGTDTTLKASMSQVAGKVAEGTTFVNLTTTAKDLVGAINEAASTGGSVDITTEITTPAAIQSFNDGGDNIPLKSLVTEIVPIQAGSGVPSPSNVRAISGHSNCIVTVSDGDSISRTTTIPLGQTVYGGSLECVNGEGQITWGMVTLNQFDFSTLSTPENHIFRAEYQNVLTNFDAPSASTIVTSAICERFTAKSYQDITLADDGCFSISRLNINRINFIDSGASTVEQFLQRNGTAKLVYPLASDTPFTFTGANIPTLSGENNIYTDCGDIQSLEYFNENGDDIASMVRLMSKDYREVLLPKRVTASVSTITSSSHDGNYLDWCAFNGRTPSNLRNPDAYTCWSAAQNEVNAWIAVDLGSVKDLYEVQLDVFSNYSGDWIGNIAVQGSNDNTNWTSILASGNANIGIVAPLQQITSTIIQVSGSYRYVRIVGIDKFTVYYNPSCFFDEIFIYAKE